MKYLNGRIKNNSGFTLVEVIIAMFILSLIASAALLAFVYSIRITQENQYQMTAMNLANDRIEYIRSLEFADVGTKFLSGGTTVYGDPKGDILQTESRIVDGVNYIIYTTIGWEDESGWELSDIDWDYKSVRVEVVPQIAGREDSLTKVANTFVTRDSTQPILTGANVALRIIRGWKEASAKTVPVPNVKISLVSGPSAPRQVKTSSSGVARFIDLSAGAYEVNLFPSTAGMILHPEVSDTWISNISSGVIAAKEFEAEYPCYLNILLKSLEGNTIFADGSIKIDCPYGTDIEQVFTYSDFTPSGYLSTDLFGKLWPVGDGYPGAYTVTDVSLENSTFFGAYEMSGGAQVPWAGTFDGPGTTKEIICYIGVIPDTPSGTVSNWADYDGTIITEDSPYLENNAIFASYDPEASIVMKTNTAADFNANGLYFENTGNATHPGLEINNNSSLNLHAGIIVFRGTVSFKSDHINQGRVTLSTMFTDGTGAHCIQGSEIGGTAYTDKMYGKIYFTKSLMVTGIEVISPGGYYFYDGLILPDNSSELIPITKDNYVE